MWTYVKWFTLQYVASDRHSNSFCKFTSPFSARRSPRVLGVSPATERQYEIVFPAQSTMLFCMRLQGKTPKPLAYQIKPVVCRIMYMRMSYRKQRHKSGPWTYHHHHQLSASECIIHSPCSAERCASWRCSVLVRGMVTMRPGTWSSMSGPPVELFHVVPKVEEETPWHKHHIIFSFLEKSSSFFFLNWLYQSIWSEFF